MIEPHSTILLAAADDVLRSRLARALEGRGYLVVAVEDGEAARVQCERVRPGYAIVDLRMPKLSSPSIACSSIVAVTSVAPPNAWACIDAPCNASSPSIHRGSDPTRYAIARRSERPAPRDELGRRRARCDASPTTLKPSLDTEGDRDVRQRRTVLG